MKPQYRATAILKFYDHCLCYHVHHSYALYKKKLETLRNARKRKCDEMGTKEVSKTENASACESKEVEMYFDP